MLLMAWKALELVQSPNPFGLEPDQVLMNMWYLPSVALMIWPSQ